ncbi:MAG TPA: ABC transporter ATP-binding protein [Phycisphaerae bacterium]|nr:ABC transporter ATP-binding protein [Phycisphaerae bacterium]HPS52607.1 ABC transporter ATP-binding protein [Phycisphaerae bacterium]
MTATQNVVHIRGLTKIFRDFWLREKVTAVSELNLDIRSREVFGLLGPNGSGKSTTLKMILGLLFPTRGTISVFGKHPTNVNVKANIGFLPEESYLYPFLDARETLDFYGQLFHLPHRQRMRRIDMLLDMVGLSAAAYRRVGEYSKGMQRRIGLAQALINDPELLILDEPTSGLDPIGTKQFKDLIRMLSQRGKTVILSSHLLGDVEDVCDRVSILYGGKLRREGNVEDMLSQKTKTQIITDELTQQDLEKIMQVLDGKSVEISHPKTRLETLFLQIVDEARRQKLKTGGATAGGKLAEFLLGNENDTGSAQGKKLLDELVDDTKSRVLSQEQAQTTAESEENRKQQARRHDMLESLVKKDTAEPNAQQPAAGADETTPQTHDNSSADRDIIDGLLGKDEDSQA